MTPAKKILARLTACAVALYLLTLTALYCLQERLLFHPAPLAPNHSFHFAAPFAEIRLPADGATLHGLYFPATPPRKGRLLFYHGNAGSLDDWGRIAARFAALGYDSYAFDYRGYGKSDGRIESEAQLNDDADRMAAYVKQQGDGRFAIVGYSLGSGLAARAAQKYRADTLLLAAPYERLDQLQQEKVPFVPHFLLKYHLPTTDYLADAHSQITLIHGSRDTLIPPVHSRRLAAQLKPGDAAYETAAAHGNLLADPQFWQIATARLTAPDQIDSPPPPNPVTITPVPSQ